MIKRKFDLFNFFYSIGAVVILVGVIAKFLEWKLQDIFLLTGLAVEAMVFTLSSIQFKEKEKLDYKWENIFPELVDNPSNPTSLIGVQKNIEDLSSRYFKGMKEYVEKFESLNSDIVKGSESYNVSLEMMSGHLTESSQAFSSFRENISKVTVSFIELHEIGEDIKSLQNNLQKMTAISIISGDKLNVFQQQLDGLNEAIFRFNNLSSGIITQFKQIGE